MKTLHFQDFPYFKPNISPPEMFELGIMGGNYFREIKSPKTGILYKKEHLKFDFLRQLGREKYLNPIYDKNINKYKVNAGTSYEYWMEKDWIVEEVDPYGWIQWYCNFWLGRRTNDDLRQIQRWKNIAGEQGRFRKQLQNKINALGKNDEKVYTKMRQTLLHWGFDTRRMIVKK